MKHLTLLISCLVSSVFLSAQGDFSVQVSLGGVTESRTDVEGRENSLRLNFRAETPDQHYSRRFRVVLDAPPKTEEGQALERYLPGGRFISFGNQYNLDFISPSRSATSIGALSGQVEVVTTTKENGGIVEMDNMVDAYDRDIPIKSAPGLSIRLISDEALLAEKKVATEERKAKLEIKLDSLRNIGEGGEQLAAMIQMLDHQLGVWGDQIMTGKNKLTIRPVGAEEKLIEISIVDQESNALYSMTMGRTYFLKRPLEPTDRIIVQVITVDNLVRYPFSIPEITLP